MYDAQRTGSGYVSTNVRTVSVGMIGVRMTKIPAKGMYFKVVMTRDEMILVIQLNQLLIMY